MVVEDSSGSRQKVEVGVSGRRMVNGPWVFFAYHPVSVGLASPLHNHSGGAEEPTQTCPQVRIPMFCRTLYCLYGAFCRTRMTTWMVVYTEFCHGEGVWCRRFAARRIPFPSFRHQPAGRVARVRGAPARLLLCGAQRCRAQVVGRVCSVCGSVVCV